jgi:hypothetical protein
LSGNLGPRGGETRFGDMALDEGEDLGLTSSEVAWGAVTGGGVGHDSLFG